MLYKAIPPPFTYRFRQMPKEELKDYFRWFTDAIPKGVTELAKAVQETPGFGNWRPDCTPNSLDTLGRWFADRVEKRSRTEEEIREIKAVSPFQWRFRGKN